MTKQVTNVKLPDILTVQDLVTYSDIYWLAWRIETKCQTRQGCRCIALRINFVSMRQIYQPVFCRLPSMIGLTTSLYVQ